MNPIVVINPNSTVRISEQIGAAIEPFESSIPFSVVTSSEGPEAIESDQDVMEAIGPMIQLAEFEAASAFVVACFSDPGLEELRSIVKVPCFGIAESAVLVAMAQARHVGVLSSVRDSLPRHERYWQHLGIRDRIVSDVAIGRGVLELEGTEAFADTLRAARTVVADGADAVVLGCTGLSHVRTELEDVLGVPVIDPCQAAVSIAVSVLKSKER